MVIGCSKSGGYSEPSRVLREIERAVSSGKAQFQVPCNFQGMIILSSPYGLSETFLSKKLNEATASRVFKAAGNNESFVLVFASSSESQKVKVATWEKPVLAFNDVFFCEAKDRGVLEITASNKTLVSIKFLPQ